MQGKSRNVILSVVAAGVLLIQPAYSQVTSTFMRTFSAGGMNGGLALESTSDGGFIGTGQHESSGAGSCDLYVYKVNSCGDPEWFKTYGSGAEDGGKWIEQTPDGGYIISGLSHFGAGAYDNWLMKLDASGNIVWNKLYGGGGNDYGLYVNTTSDGGYIMSGFFENLAYGATDISLIKTDAAGNTQWVKVYGGAGSDWGDYVEQTPDGGYIITGYTDSYGAGGPDVYVLKVDAAGNLQWSKTYGTAGDDSQPWGNLAYITSDGGYIISSHTNGSGAGNFDYWVLKLDVAGNVEWSKTYGGAGEESSRHIEPTPDGGYIVGGYASSWGAGSMDAYVVKIDALGNEQWSKVYGGAGIDRMVGIKNTQDGGYSMSLLSTSFGANYFDPIFMKTDSTGYVGCNESTPPTIVGSFAPTVTTPPTNSGVPAHVESSATLTPGVFAPVDNFLCFECVTVPDFVASDTIACLGESVDFYNTTSIGQRCYEEWEIDGQIVTGVDTMTYIFTTPGIYTVSLLSRCGISSDTISASVLVVPDPVADFTFSNECMNTAVSFTDASTTPPFVTVLTQREWDFGDGSPLLIAQNPTHQYTAPGQYNVTLTVTNNENCVNSVTKVVTVHPEPVAGFSFTDVCDGNPVNFQDTSSVLTGNIVAWDWNFDDGTTSAVQNNVHNYLNPGQFDVVLTVTTDSGCVDSFTYPVNNFPVPVPDFTVANACLNVISAFNNTSTVLTGTIATNAWDFGDGSTSAAASPTHLYAADGSYTVKLVTTSDEGCVDSVSKTISVNPLPVADFSALDTCQGVVVSFTDLSAVTSTNIVQWDWDFGGNGTSTNSNPTHAFTTHGTFNVELRVETDSACADSITYPVIAHPNPVAEFSFDDECFGDANDFVSLSTVATGTIDVYDWDLDAGITATQDTSFAYAAAGQYNITLDVTTNFGCTHSVAHSLEVYNNPVADFSTANVCLTTPATFDDLSTSLSGNISSREWDLGDGTLLSIGSSVPFQHTYSTPGTYTVQLITTSQYGCDDTISQDIVIHPMPVVDFSYDVVCFGTPTSFTDLSTVSSGAVTEWDWNFNGTPVSGTATPQFTFSQPGLNGVTLTATTDSGCVSTNEYSVLVWDLPEPDFTFNKVCENDTTFFTNISTIANGTIDGWLWNFADGGASSAQSDPQHIFSAAGFYDVTLIGTSDNQCVDSVTHSVEVYPLPVPAFSAVPDSGCQPLRVDFTDLSTIAAGYNINQWRWNFGITPPAISGTQNTFFVYDTAGTFTVTYTVTSTNQCAVTITETDLITVFPKPNAAFNYMPQPTTIVYPFITFTDHSSVATGGITNWLYDMGDGTSESIPSPTHTYRDTLTYYVTQIVTTDRGCTDTVTHAVVIDPEFTIYVPTAFTPDDDGLNDIFLVEGIGIKYIALRVFNRWGEQLFFSSDLNLGWNGRKFNTGAKLEEGGLYVYFIEITDVNAHTYEFKGTVTLVR
ncbi:MAG: hypothetical protein POELPBGB_00951 [Bacteroidia bacterium]|nr:hypothetical protein [Bacteroidia bacterium]